MALDYPHHHDRWNIHDTRHIDGYAKHQPGQIRIRPELSRPDRRLTQYLRGASRGADQRKYFYSTVSAASGPTNLFEESFHVR
jgi:hypothetical protein